MKKIYLIGALAALAFTSCQKDDLGTDFNNDPNAVRINASVGEGIDITRSNPLGDAEAQIRFNQGDKICVSVSGQESVSYTLDPDGSTWTPEMGKYLKWESNTMEFSAYYPVERDNAQDYFLLPTDQSDLTKIVSADYMTVDNQITVKPEGGASASIKLNRKNARIIVKITSFGSQYTGTPTVSDLKIYSGVQQHGPGSSFYPVAVTPYVQNGTGGVNTVFTALVIPAARSTVADLVTLTDSEGNQLSVKGIPLHSAGMSYTYNLMVGKDGITVGSVTVKDWNDEVVIPDGEAEENLSVWDGTYDGAAMLGLGTQEKPFTITSAAQLVALASGLRYGGTYANDFFYYRLETSIDLAGHEWFPIGTNFPFRGVFDGNGYYIKGLKITDSSSSFVGLFGYVRSKFGEISEIKNLRVLNADINVTTFSSGGGAIVVNNMGPEDPQVEGNPRGIISNVHVTGKITMSQITDCGGLIKYAGYVDVTDCTADVEVASVVTDGAATGGFVGSSNASTFTNCTVKGSATGKWHTGGFAGQITNGSVFKNCTVENMTIDSPYPQGVNGACTGGFAGWINDGATITDCHVEQTSVSTPCFGGGFAGWIRGTKPVEITGCTVSGSVTGSYTLGGFAGEAFCDGSTIELKNCSTSSSILTNNWNVGGFVGWSNAAITDCSASGDINQQALWDTPYDVYKTGGFVGTNAGMITRGTYSGTMTYADDAQCYGGFLGNDKGGTTVGCRFDGTKNPDVAANGLSVNNEAAGTNEISNSLP